MKDKDMRPVLIEWLKTQHESIRIYEEKSIGSSICDVMAVTDTLSGFEIKSDVDDLRRLGTQAHPADLTVLGFSVCAPEVQDAKKPYWCLCKDGETYTVEIGTSVSGNATRIVTNTFGKFYKTVQAVREAFEEAIARKRDIDNLLANPDTTYVTRLRQMECKAAQLKAELKGET